MTSFLNKLTGKPQASASVVDGKLILSFPGAITPVVWQMDLSKAKASALEVQENKGGYSLILKTPKGENLDIAPFDDRTKAVDGLMAASRALESAHGHMHSAGASNENAPAHPHPGYQKKKGGKLLPIILSLLAVFVLFWIWNLGTLQPPAGYQAANNTANTASSPQSAAESSGVAVSADDFLTGR